MSSNIIKRSSLKKEPSNLRGVVKRPVLEARAEARRLIEEAEAEAASIRSEAELHSQQLRVTAYREGFESALSELNQHLLDAVERRDSALVEVEQDVLRLAVKIAEKIIGREIQRDETTLVDIVGTALRNARQQEVLVIRINPSDVPVVQEHHARLDPTGRARFLDIVPDPRVTHGGCIIEGASGTIDAQLDTQLRILERALLTRVQGESRINAAGTTPDET